MCNHFTHPRQRRLSAVVTFIAVLALASGGVAMAATGYAQLIKAANRTAPQPPATITVAPGCWQPPGCVFPPEKAFGATYL